ncbi:BET1-like protein isoform X2 [Cebus imitator]|uniref:BET1-like protein isoform X2 n=1 Tax=Cebus imitator TaxID=2715852 RepID=UPI00189C327E|nr:BET1-like protein isoform X2 [Cebus imitator]
MADWAQSPGAVEEILDRENKRMTDSLASKVTRLKSLALDIDRDAEDQNRYLDGMPFAALPGTSGSGLDFLSGFLFCISCCVKIPQRESGSPAAAVPDQSFLRGLMLTLSPRHLTL